MAELNANRRNKLPKNKFALPAGGPKGEPAYPIDTKARAASALARVEANGTPAEKAKVRAAVKKAYPDLPSSKGDAGSAAGRSNKARDSRKGGK